MFVSSEGHCYGLVARIFKNDNKAEFLCSLFVSQAMASSSIASCFAGAPAQL
jgi:hypothetical protein